MIKILGLAEPSLMPDAPDAAKIKRLKIEEIKTESIKESTNVLKAFDATCVPQ